MSTVGAMSGTFDAHLLVGGREEVDHPARRERDLADGLGSTDGERTEEVFGWSHDPDRTRRIRSARNSPRQRQHPARHGDEAVVDERVHDRTVEGVEWSRPVGQRSEDPASGLPSAAFEACLLRADSGRAAGRIRRGPTRPMPRASSRNRARRAVRHGSAHERTEIHHHLVPHPPLCRRHHRIGKPLDACRRQPLPRCPGQHRGRCSCRPPQRRVRRRTRAPRAPVYGPIPGSAIKASRSSGSEPPCSATTRRAVACRFTAPAGIAEALPQPQHIAQRCRCTRGRGGERTQEQLPLRDHPAHLGLLQHHLRNEDRPRVTLPAPRQIADPWHAPCEDRARIDRHAPVSRPRRRCRRTDACAAALRPASTPAPCA